LDEIREIVNKGGMEVECFLHGALCYSYSGLCLYSSMLRGRSGNRGRCAYPCRDAFRSEEGQDRKWDGHYFSMKDLALPDEVNRLRNAGVTSLKIEGRKKSALYVAAVVRYYRALLDGVTDRGCLDRYAEDLMTVYSRPWTSLYLRGGRKAGVVDSGTVGHRGAPVGEVARVIPGRAGQAPRLMFQSSRALELHDGLQMDIPGQAKPFGFPVDILRVVEGRQQNSRKVITAPAGSWIEVDLPDPCPPIPPRATVYCASSQEVKRSLRFARPKPGLHRVRFPFRVHATLGPHAVRASACAQAAGLTVEVEHVLDGTFEPARVPGQVDDAARKAFSRLGDTPLVLDEIHLQNPAGLFVAISDWNQLRRELTAKWEQAWQAARSERAVRALAQAVGDRPGVSADTSVRWSIKVDQPGLLDEFVPADLADVHEGVVDAMALSREALSRELLFLTARLGRDRIRLALPSVTRTWECEGLRERVQSLMAEGWRKWEAAGLAAWSQLGTDSGVFPVGLDVTTDWPLYVTNSLAGLQLREMGSRGVVLSPENGGDNLGRVVTRLGGDATVIVYQDTPLFISETCVRSAVEGSCGGKGCSWPPARLVSEQGEKTISVVRNCRTITISQSPFCLSGHLGGLQERGVRSFRAEFILRDYTAGEVVALWRQIRQGRPIKGTYGGNYVRGMA
jgi:putative protease